MGDLPKRVNGINPTAYHTSGDGYIFGSEGHDAKKVLLAGDSVGLSAEICSRVRPRDALQGRRGRQIIMVGGRRRVEGG